MTHATRSKKSQQPSHAGTTLRETKRRRHMVKQEGQGKQGERERGFRSWLNKEGFVLHDSLDLRFSGKLIALLLPLLFLDC